MTSAKRGFTLIELLVVVALIALSISVIGPRIGNTLDSSRLKSSARDLLATARYARNLAQIQQREVTLAVNVSARTYAVDNDETRRIRPPKTNVSVVGARSERQSEDLVGIRFFADGSTTGGEIELSLNRQVFAIEIDWLTGAARFTE